jgi:hypothetical protein
MKTGTLPRRTAASIGTLIAVMALCTAPAQADDGSSPCDVTYNAATVVRTPQSARVLADGESGTKRPV